MSRVYAPPGRSDEPAGRVVTAPLAPALGTPLPDVPHAVSVQLPTWADVIGYEEGDPRVLGALRAGYPRFVFHRDVQALMAAAAAEVAGEGERVLVFPSAQAAGRCAAHLARSGYHGVATPFAGVHAVRFEAAAWDVARQAWQHAGEVVSSRRARAALAGAGADGADLARGVLRTRVAGLAGVPAGEVTLHPSGMAAIAHALRLARALHPGRPTAQLGFPYLDSLKLQERLGDGCAFWPHADDAALGALAAALAQGRLAAVFVEHPGNPLMRCVDLPRVAALTRAAGVPLVVDDSAGTFANHDLTPWADVLVASLTKAFSGNGDALGGALALNPASPLHAALAAARDAMAEPETLFGDDAAALLAGAADFEARVARTNAAAEVLAEALAAHPAIAKVHHPRFETPDLYEVGLRPGGGRGAMLSLVLADPAQAPRFYDRLAIAKGPSFGLRETLACPYTLLAHYGELAWAESCGVARHLIRVSVGLEAPHALVARFEAALA